jgi:hypothetical protein
MILLYFFYLRNKFVKEKVGMNTPSELCEHLSDLISKSLEDDGTSILHLRKVERYDSRIDDPETGFYYDDEDAVEWEVANREIYNYSSSLNSVTKYLEEIGCCFEVTYLNHIHSRNCFVSAGYDCYASEEFDLDCEKEVDPCVIYSRKLV